MTMYQVLNEENSFTAAFQDMQEAMYYAQDFTVWDDEHYYHVEELALEVV